MTEQTILLDLGTKDYSEVWGLQKMLVESRAEGKIPDILILVEHNHVLTIGRRGSEVNIHQRDLPIYCVERGGDVTYHGPGQLVGYPILSLEQRRLDIHSYLRDLEETIIRTLRDYGINSSRNEKQTGVWVNERKITSIGVAVARWITYHGFALNANTDLSYFQKIKPCGLDGSVITSMSEILGSVVDLNRVKARIQCHFEEVFETTLVLENNILDLQNYNAAEITNLSPRHAM